LIFIIFYVKVDDEENMEGYTLAEMAEALGVPIKTIEMRLFRAGIKPMVRGAIYDKSALEAIRNAPGKGRPRKTPPPADETGEK
jgi:Zn-dependent peptidase ImmA (M78 family)